MSNALERILAALGVNNKVDAMMKAQVVSVIEEVPRSLINVIRNRAADLKQLEIECQSIIDHDKRMNETNWGMF